MDRIRVEKKHFFIIIISFLKNFKFSFSLPKFNLPLIGTFKGPTPPGPYRATTCRGRGLNYGPHTYFLTTQKHRGPPRMSDQHNARATSETAQTWKTIHTQPPQQGKDGMMTTTAKWHSGTLGAWSFLTFVLQVRKNPEKTSPRKFVPTGVRTRGRCVTSAYATACATAVD